MGKLVTQSEFAKLEGVSRQYVSKLKSGGRLVFVDGKIDVEASRKMLADTSDPASPAKAKAEPQPGPREFPPDMLCGHANCGHAYRDHPDDNTCIVPKCGCWVFERPKPVPLPPEPDAIRISDTARHEIEDDETVLGGVRVSAPLSDVGLSSFNEARAFKEHQLALKHKHQLEVEQGKFVEAATIKHSFDRFCVAIRTSMRGIPRLKAPDLVGLDAAAIEEELLQVIDIELERLSKNPFDVAPVTLEGEVVDA